MHVLPGSHKEGERQHHTTEDPSNILYLGQTVHGVDNDLAKAVTLEAGEASLHNGWILHTSHSNTSDDRRIGLTLNYISTDMHQTENDEDTAILVRGVDEYKHFKSDTPATSEFTEEAWISRQEHEDRILNTYKQTNPS
jgi:ectoine hydroxylase-related dioxygenase (phytanoyl-CoA dioxygenase family)